MCNKERPTLDAIIGNLKSSMPLSKKVRLFIRNSALKILKLRSCCGHPGEPGC